MKMIIRLNLGSKSPSLYRNYFNQNAQKIKIDLKQLINTQENHINEYFEQTYTPC